MRSPPLAIAVLLSVGCVGGAPGPAEQAADGATLRAEPRDAPATVPVSDWIPSRAHLVRASALADPEGRDARIEEIDALPLAERVAVWRAGLRLADPAAAQVCASMCKWRWLDDAECRRAEALLVDATLEPGPGSPEVTFFHFPTFEILSAESLHGILARITRVSDERVNASDPSTLHKHAAAEHLPAIAALIAARPGLDEGFRELLWIPCELTDRHREDVARAVLGGVAPPSVPAAADGLPPLLATVLRSFFLEHGRDASRLGAWALRWLRDATPSEADADLLVAVARAAPGLAEPVWAMRHLRDERTLAFLREGFPEVVPGAADDEEGAEDARDPTAAAALAARGDAAALDWLVATASAEARTTADREALAYLFAIAPDRAASLATSLLLGDDAETAAATLERLVRARDEVRALLGVRFDLAALDGLKDAALRSGISGERLAALGAALPQCRTRRLAEEAVRRLGASAGVTSWAEGDPSDAEQELAFLETAAPASFRALLRTWAGRPEPAVRDLALRTLLAIGDPGAGRLLVAWFRSGSSGLGAGSPDEHYRGEQGLIELARSPGPAVEVYLREIAEGTATLPDTPREVALQGLAVLAGFPESVQIFEEPAPVEGTPETPLPDAVRDEAERLLLAGRPFDAFAAVLAARPDQPFWNEGDVRDPRVAAHLRGLRDRRELELHAWALGELAIQGDAAAREEHWSVMKGGRYRWVEEATGRPMTLGFDFTTIPTWLDQLESNCCHERSVQLFVFEHLSGFEPCTSKGVGDTHAAEIRRWWEESGGRFVRSRVLGLFVPAPR